MLYKLAGVDPQAEMSWKRYALAVLAFNALGALAVYGFLRLQQWLPVNPQGFGPMTRRRRVQYGGQLRDQHELAGLLA